MPKTNNTTGDDDLMPAEIDFRGGIRGKYAAQFPPGSKIVLLDADVAEVFPTAEAANDALRDLASIIKRTEKRAPSKERSLKAVKKSLTHTEAGK